MDPWSIHSLPVRLTREFSHMSERATTNPASSSTRIVRGGCPHDCPDACAMLVTVESGRAIRVAGDPEHPFTRGFLCTKVNRYVERTYHRDRLLHPMRRVGPKGKGQFERITWDEALNEIAERLNTIRASSDRRFFHTIGASLLDRTICSMAGTVGMRMTVGANIGADPEGIPQSDLVLLWGTNTLTANPHLWPFVLEAREAGATIIAIDPIRTRTAAQCDEWIGIRPGTDAALALAMMHVIFAEGLEDKGYIEKYCLGGDQLRERVKEWTPERAASLCGIPVETIVSLAR